MEAVVLRHSDWGEADRILWLYTRQMGKVRAIAKGVRKARSRKAGHLEPFIRATLMLARGRDFMIVTQAESIDAHLNLRDDLQRTSYAAYVVELIDRFTIDEDDNQQIYRLLVDTLDRLDEANNPAFPVRYYEVRLLDLLGYRPQLFQCAACNKEIQPEDQYFSPSQGGVLCPVCGQGVRDARPISLSALKVLRHFQRSGFNEASRIQLGASVGRELEQIMVDYFTYLLERSLNTPSFLRKIKGNHQT